MTKGRLEAFSDGVLAIIITIMVLELKPPQTAEPEALTPLVHTFLSYLLSFGMLGIYWNNHHHLLQTAKQINGLALLANLHLLFWLSLVPFVTAWMGQSSFAPWPVAAYGVVMFLAGIAYQVLTRVLIACQGEDSTLAAAVGRDVKGKLSLLIYAVAMVVSLFFPRLACGLYVLVAIMWLIPDRRIEKHLTKKPAGKVEGAGLDHSSASSQSPSAI